jgi:uncharacterized protein YqkB
MEANAAEMWYNIEKPSDPVVTLRLIGPYRTTGFPCRKEASHMHLTLSSEAAEMLRQRQGDRPGTLRLVYDTEGCGCAVDGVPMLWLTDAHEAGDMAIAGQPLQVWMDPRQTIFFEDEVRLDYRNDSRTFRLQSDSQIYNSMLQVIDRRTQPAGI